MDRKEIVEICEAVIKARELLNAEKITEEEYNGLLDILKGEL